MFLNGETDQYYFIDLVSKIFSSTYSSNFCFKLGFHTVRTDLDMFSLCCAFTLVSFSRVCCSQPYVLWPQFDRLSSEEYIMSLCPEEDLPSIMFAKTRGQKIEKVMNISVLIKNHSKYRTPSEGFFLCWCLSNLTIFFFFYMVKGNEKILLPCSVQAGSSILQWNLLSIIISVIIVMPYV